MSKENTGASIEKYEKFSQRECKEIINIASMIDHTLLKQDATEEQIINLCKEAIQYKFAAVCVNSSNVPLASKILKGSGVKACCVIGFPLGAASTGTKAFEAREAVANGATELDMVINVGAAKAGKWDVVKQDIQAVVNEAKGKAIVKVILETCLLSNEEKKNACLAAKHAGANFVKTSTGFSTGGATIEDIELMRQVVGRDIGVKASGGVRDYKTAAAMIKAGANRLGTSSGIAIVKNQNSGASPQDMGKY